MTTVGYGLPNIGKLPADPAPWDTLGRNYWGSGADRPGRHRVGRRADRRRPRVPRTARRGWCSRSAATVCCRARSAARCRSFGTPAAALTFLLGASVAIGLGFGFGFQPLPAFSLLSLIVTLCALGVYALAQIGLARYFWRLGQFNPLWHGLVPTLAVAAIVYLFIKNVSPKPPYPSDLAIWISIGWAVAGHARRGLARDLQAGPARGRGRDHRRG